MLSCPPKDGQLWEAVQQRRNAFRSVRDVLACILQEGGTIDPRSHAKYSVLCSTENIFSVRGERGGTRRTPFLDPRSDASRREERKGCIGFSTHGCAAFAARPYLVFGNRCSDKWQQLQTADCIGALPVRGAYGARLRLCRGCLGASLRTDKKRFRTNFLPSSWYCQVIRGTTSSRVKRCQPTWQA